MGDGRSIMNNRDGFDSKNTDYMKFCQQKSTQHDKKLVKVM